MQRDYYQRLAELFDATVEQPDELRDAFAERSCEGDTQLLRELRAMLDADRREQPLLDRPLSLPEAAFDTAEAVVGERIGAFRLVRRIGDGGMGTVWLAERSEGGFEQRVALKRVRHELDTPGSRQRFGQERRILAALEHPAIARLLDGGFDARGAPWFAMEYVDGETLLHYARGNALDLRARVGLLRDICFAVAYAHGRLVVHRDLKPANILVTRDGSVKLLDFGTAGMLEAGRGTSAKDETALPRGVVMATPDYAAPEQLRSGDITTATDVYALGVILYELLTDALPYTLVTRMPEAMAEELRGISPVPPSQRAPDAWARRLCGDFDAIAAKAMAFNPVDRYVSAEALAADLVAALDDRPVAARPLGRAARARKFVRRHRLGAAMSVATLLILAVGVAGTLWQAHQARMEAARAEVALDRASAVQRFLLGVFDAAQPLPGSSGIATERELADRASANLDTLLADQPQARIDLLIAIGEVYRKLGFFERSRKLLERALTELDETHTEATDPRRVDALLGLGRAEFYADAFADAAAHLELANVLARRVHVPVALHADILYELGSSQSALRRLDTAMQTLTQAEQEATSDAQGQVLVPVIRMEQALTLRRIGRLDDAIAEGERALESARRYFGEADVRTSNVLSTLGAMERRAGNLPRAEVMLREAMSIDMRAYGQPQPAPTNNLATVLQDRGREQESGALFRHALDLAAQRYGPDAVATASYLRNLALQQLDAGQAELAETNLRRAYARYSAGNAIGSASNLEMREQLVRMLIYRGKSSEATALLDEVLADAPHAAGAETTLRLARMDRAWLALMGGNLAAAREGLELAQRSMHPYDLETFDHVRLMLLAGDIAQAARDSNHARGEWRRALELARGKLDPVHPLAREAEARLAAE